MKGIDERLLLTSNGILFVTPYLRSKIKILERTNPKSTSNRISHWRTRSSELKGDC